MELSKQGRVQKTNYKYRMGKSSFSISQLILGAIMLVFSVITLYPFLYCLAYSLSDAQKAMTTNVTIIPIGFTFKNYLYVLKTNAIYTSAMVSVIRTVVGVIYSIAMTGFAAYAISKKDLPYNRVLTIFLIIPMYISGGLLPTYVLIHDLHLFNNILVYILPNGFWAFNMLLMRTYFDTIPVSLEESAKLDGAGDLRIFFRIIVPLSMPIIAVIAMFNGVWQWNAWFDALLYVQKSNLKPLQSVLQMLLSSNMADSMSQMHGKVTENTISPETIRMATLMVTTLPIVFIYPFFQKYFIKGMMIGAVKA